jgi:hypothetical protein
MCKLLGAGTRRNRRIQQTEESLKKWECAASAKSFMNKKDMLAGRVAGAIPPCEFGKRVNAEQMMAYVSIQTRNHYQLILTGDYWRLLS